MKTFYKHIHAQNIDPRLPGVTLLAVDEGEGNIKLAWSVCSANDNFSRKIGREVAQWNYDKGRVVTGKITEDNSVYQALVDILDNGEGLKEEDHDYWNQAMNAIIDVEEEFLWHRHLTNLTEALSDTVAAVSVEVQTGDSGHPESKTTVH